MYFYGFDVYYLIFVIPAVIFAMWAQYNVTSTFNKYSSVASDRGITGSEVARNILQMNGLSHIKVVETVGNLTDHFDPKEGVIRLSASVYNVGSAAAVGVAAHEAGHAVQHSVGYFPIKIRTAIIPITRIGSTLAIPLVLLGLIFSYMPLSYIGIILFCAAVLFQLVTLPVEFNASRRALNTLTESSMLSSDGLGAAKKVLRAAALTYVAALAVSLANLLRLLFLVRGRDNRRR